MSQPIDYARGDSADVVRMKFRRRVVWFVMATVVVSVIGIGWIDSLNKPRWLIGGISQQQTSSVSVLSRQGWIHVYGPERTTWLNAKWAEGSKAYGNRSIGIFERNSKTGEPNWVLFIRYRTLFILAMIPWLITLIRLIRIRQRINPKQTEPRTK